MHKTCNEKKYVVIFKMHVELECVGSETKEFFLEKKLVVVFFCFLFCLFMMMMLYSRCLETEINVIKNMLKRKVADT